LKILAGLTLTLAWAMSGCLFQPREAEPPTTGTEVVYLPRGEALNVWGNAEISLNAIDSPGWGDAVGSEAVGSSFRYIPDGQTLINFPGVDWANWTREQEMNFINNFFNNVSAVQANLRYVDVFVEDPSGGAADWRFTYLIDVTDVSGAVTRYGGTCEVRLRLRGSFWYIEEWIDEEGASDPDSGAILPTMGSLRGAFASK
jgi:hypothetical protein